jgi:hypothetical protein
MKNKIIEISDEPRWSDYAELWAEPDSEASIISPKPSGWYRFCAICLGNLAALAIMGAVYWALIWAGTEGWKHVNDWTHWIVKVLR